MVNVFQERDTKMCIFKPFCDTEMAQVVEIPPRQYQQNMKPDPGISSHSIDTILPA